MTADVSFQDLIARVRGGDEAAAAEVVRRYEPVIRRAVRVRLRDSRLRRVVDSMDVCQSVFGSFFVRAATGQYDIDTPEGLLRLLVTIAKNKTANRANHEHAGCRDFRRVDRGAALSECPARDSTPSRQVAARELLVEARGRMSAEEQVILEGRQQGKDWAEIAAEVGGSPDAVRVRLARAAARVTRLLGLDGADD